MAKIEILAPVGSEEMLRAAVFSGADAVYLGFSGFNARTGAGNFDADSLQEAVRFCHARGVAVHVALNTTVYGTELSALEQAIRAVAASGADAVICQDLAVATLIGKIAPQLPRHGSTQMSVHTLQGALELKELGFTRVVLARELSLPEVEHISFSSSAPCRVWTLIWVEPWRGRSGAIRPMSCATARSWQMTASAPLSATAFTAPASAASSPP